MVKELKVSICAYILDFVIYRVAQYMKGTTNALDLNKHQIDHSTVFYAILSGGQTRLKLQ